MIIIIIKSINTKASIKKKKLFLEGGNSIYDKNKQEITLKKIQYL